MVKRVTLEFVATPDELLKAAQNQPAPSIAGSPGWWQHHLVNARTDMARLGCMVFMALQDSHDEHAVVALGGCCRRHAQQVNIHYNKKV